MKNNENVVNSKQIFYKNLPALDLEIFEDLPPTEETNYRFRNSLKLTEDFQIQIFENALSIKSKHPNLSPPGGNLRREESIKTFSENSKRNLKKILSKINYSFYPQMYFATLTFHHLYPSRRKELKTMIDKLNKRLDRNNKEMHYIWKLEFQKRGAPHLHYILLFKKNHKHIDEIKIKRAIKKHWLDLLPEFNEDIFNYSVKTEPVHNREQKFRYMVKYMDKMDDSDIVENVGRRWARSSDLIMSEKNNIKVDEKFYSEFRKLLFEHMKKEMNLDEETLFHYQRCNSFEICLSSESSLDLVKMLADRMNRSYIIAQIQNSPP